MKLPGKMQIPGWSSKPFFHKYYNVVLRGEGWKGDMVVLGEEEESEVGTRGDGRRDEEE